MKLYKDMLKQNKYKKYNISPVMGLELLIVVNDFLVGINFS
jgi:hypothetical protein|tara:strand:- start:838 stop:960 length:123 start_codon:yes stop_codon:yes gene_type:complete